MRWLKNIFAFAAVMGLPAIGAIPPQSGQLIKATLPAPSLKNNLLGTPAEQPALIYLPPSYAAGNRRYPVVYFLPGFTTDLSELIDASYQGFIMNQTMDELIGRGKIKEMIVVVVNGRNFLGGSFYVNSPVTGNWEDYVVKDVVGFMDTRYRTLAVPESRGISGTSMGGFGAIHLAMRHPDIFTALYSMSPGLFAPRGLDDQGMFIPPSKVGKYLDKQEEWNRCDDNEGKRRFAAFIEELYASKSRDDYFWAFAYAYGAAFSPAPGKKVPHIDYPYAKSGEAISVNQAVLKKYEKGFGDWPAKIRKYQKNFKKLRAITIEYGKNDRYQWIVQGSIYFSKLLKEAGIKHALWPHDGGHEDGLRDSWENRMLPFFSRWLKSR